MNPTSLEQRVLQTWAAHFQFPVESLQIPGTTLFEDPQRDTAKWVLLWPAGKQTVIQVAPAHTEAVREVLAKYPDNHAITGLELQAAWDGSELNQDKFYVLDTAQFQPFAPDTRYTVRVLTDADQLAFDAFQARCSAEDRDTGEIAIQHELAVGVFDGKRIVAGASMFAWMGFSDIGVLSDPTYRRQGLGKAAVSFLCGELLRRKHERVILYRHELNNTGSQGIAESLHFHFIAMMEGISPPKVWRTFPPDENYTA